MYTNNMNRLFAEGGMNDQGGTVDPVSGNDVPPGSLQNEVRDDIDAKLSEGEFVIPADVVRYIGLERLMKLRDEAKQGLSRMAEIGQMGNAQEVENPEALHEGEDGFESEIDDIMQEVEGEQMGEKKFAAGGLAEPGADLLNKYNIPRTSITNPALDVRAYKNKEGRVMYITFFNDKPSIAIPAGYEFAGSAGQFIAETKKTDDKKEVVTATGTVEAGGDGVSVGGGPAVGGSTGATGTGIGNSAIGISIGAIANAIDSITNPNPTPVSVTDAVASPSDAAVAANAAAVASVTDSNDAESGPAGNAAAAAAAADSAAAASANAAAASANAASGVSGEGGTGGDGSAGAATSGSPGWAKGGLVAKRTKKPTLAQKRGIASKK
jgi:hypothetical protein